MSTRIVRCLMLLGASVATSALIAGPASAQNTDARAAREEIVLSGHLLVPEGETVETAVIFHGPATIDGVVTKSVVSFDGRVEVSGTVHGDVVAFNGPVLLRSGATVDGDLVTFESPTVEPGATVRGDQRRVSTEFDAADLGFAGRFAWWVGYSASTLILGLLLLTLAPALDLAIARAAREHTGAAIGFGAAAFFLLPVLGVLLLVIVVAIPLGLFLLLALALLYTAGYTAAAHALGRRLVRPPTSRFLAFLAGWAILRAIALIPVVGGLLWVVASIVGLGVLWVAARRSTAATPEAPTLPPMPQPATT